MLTNVASVVVGAVAISVIESLRGEKGYLGLYFKRDTVHHGGEGMAAGVWGQPITWHRQSRSREWEQAIKPQSLPQ